MSGSIEPGWRVHPLRDRLLAEAHARPAMPLTPPVTALRIATLSGEEGAAADRAHMADLCARLAQPQPGSRATWCALDAGGWRLRWERHTEFSTWTFFRPARDDVLTTSAIDLVPSDWLAALPGQVIVATLIDLRVRAVRALEHFAPDAVASQIGDGAAQLYGDFRPDARGFTRFLMVGKGDAAVAGRLALAVLEIETYRMMALLAFPLAGEAGQSMRQIESEATALAQTVASETGAENDRTLLDRLAALAGTAEAMRARTAFRFRAAKAYHEIVLNRIATLRESRVDGRQTIGEFMERRLGPAMRTCDSMAQREHDAVERIARIQALLETRVGIASEAASVGLLASMDKRAEAQLRLQRTVEGLSVAAVSYYAVGLLLYALKALTSAVPSLKPEVAAGIATPLVIGVVWLVLQRLKNR